MVLSDPDAPGRTGDGPALRGAAGGCMACTTRRARRPPPRSRRRWRRPGMRVLLWALLLAVALKAAHPRKSKRKGRDSPRSAAGGIALTAQHSQGAQYLAEKRLPEALESFGRAVALGDPVHRETRAMRSKTLGLMGRLDEAVAEIDLALEMQLRPSQDGSWFGDQWMMRGLLLKQLGAGREEEAIESLVKAHQLKADQGHSKPELLVSLCVVHEEMHASTDAAKRATYLNDGIEYCDAAIVAGVAAIDAAGDTKQAQKSRHALKAARLAKGKILFHQDRVVEAWHATDAAAELAEYHKPLQVALAESEAAASVELSSSDHMHLLWPIAASNSAFAPQDLPFHIARQSTDVLGTPVWIAHALGAETINNRLREAAQAMRMQDPQGKRVSNVGGWHSSKRRGAEFASFLQDTASQRDDVGDAAKTLYSWIMHQVDKFVHDLQIPARRGVPHVSLKESWININGPGHHNMAHNHLTSTLSGCYYISSGYSENNGIQYRTGLKFEGPWDRPAEAGSEWTDNKLGSPGTLALWPGPLNHSVPVHNGDTERISMAFNVAVTLKP